MPDAAIAARLANLETLTMNSRTIAREYYLPAQMARQEAQRAGAKVGFGFDEAALEAAKRATFSPPTKDGVRVKMWSTIRVAFKP